jgi:hypothetical protein
MKYFSFRNAEGKKTYFPENVYPVIVQGVRAVDQHGRPIVGQLERSMVILPGAQVLVSNIVAIKLINAVASKVVELSEVAE